MKITVHENEKILIASSRSDVNKKITRKDAETLRSIESKYNGIFKWGYNYLKPQQWVGIISTDNLDIEILPKISNNYSEKEIRKTLLFMFQKAQDIPVKNNINSNVKLDKYGLVELFISNFLLNLEEYIKEGLLSSYSKKEENLHAVKGALAFTEHINRNSISATRFYCSFSKLVTDNKINRIIKYTLLKITEISMNVHSVGKAKSFLRNFAEVQLDYDAPLYINQIVFDRLNFRVKPIIEYCQLFLEGYSIQLTAGVCNVKAMLFDMNKLFEQFIFNTFKKIYPGKVRYQHNQSYLLENISSNKKRIKLRPDILLNLDIDNRMVVDTKWKIIDKFAKESDVYQMNAYVTAIPLVNEVILVYPFVPSINSIIGNYKFLNQIGKDKMLKIRAVKMELVRNEKLFREHLKRLVET